MTEDKKITQTATDSKTNGIDSIRKWTLIILVLCGLLLLWHLASDRITPYTSQARVKGYVVPVSPQVSGLVDIVNVDNNQQVVKDEVLLEIDDTRYELVVQAAQAELELAGQEIGAGTAGIKSAEANVASAQAELKRATQSHERVNRIYSQDPGAVSKSERDFAQSSLDKAHSGVAAADSELERTKQELGEEGTDNPRIQAAIAALEQARFDVANTKVRAPTSGLVTDLRVDQGYYAQPGQPLMTFIAINDVWIEAYFRENSLGRIKPGDPVEIALDIQPGKIFEGKVASLGAGVSLKQSGLGDLPTVEDPQGWLRDAQRFPVIVAFDESLDEVRLGRRIGAQADVIVYTGDNTLMNALGWLWIRIASIFSYAY